MTLPFKEMCEIRMVYGQYPWVFSQKCPDIRAVSRGEKSNFEFYSSDGCPKCPHWVRVVFSDQEETRISRVERLLPIPRPPKEEEEEIDEQEKNTGAIA